MPAFIKGLHAGGETNGNVLGNAFNFIILQALFIIAGLKTVGASLAVTGRKAMVF